MKHHPPYVHLVPIDRSRNTSQFLGVSAVRLRACPVDAHPHGDLQEQLEEQLMEQMDFINTLYSVHPPHTYALRYISHPQPDSFVTGKIDLVLLIACNEKTSADASHHTHQMVINTLDLLMGRYPDHLWEPVSSKEEFMRLWEPFHWESTYVVEIRRREDLITVDTMHPRPGLGKRHYQKRPQTPISEGSIYFVHKFIPRPGTLAPFLRTLLLHSAPVIWQITLSPTTLTPTEEQILLEEINRCEERVSWSHPTRSTMQKDPGLSQLRARDMAEQLLKQFLRLKDAPYFVTISLISLAPIPSTLAENCGVEITAPVGVVKRTVYSLQRDYFQMGGYDVIIPNTQRELNVARRNAQFLLPKPWGPTVAPKPLRRLRYLMDALEAASVFRFPVSGDEGLPGLFTFFSRNRPLPPEIASLNKENSKNTIPIGENRYLTFSEPVVLSEPDRRQHLYVVGQTGTGKTTLLKSLILSDMYAGHGLAVIDPHGDLFDELLGLIPPHRQKDVVVFDPTDMDYPIGFNILECKNPQERHFVVREFKAIMEKLLEDQYGKEAKSFGGPIFWQHMQMNLLLVTGNPRKPGTLLEFYEIFQHKNYWKKFLPVEWADSKLRRWITTTLVHLDYTNRSLYDDSSIGEYISSKFEDFVFDPMLRLIFGQHRSRLDIQQIMDEGKILLINLAKGELSEANAQFLGLLLMAKIQSAALQRSHLPAEKRRLFYIYVDEFQSIATQNFIMLLSEARKFGVALTLANQFVSQIRNPRITDSIFGNVGTLISFRVGLADAEEYLEKQFYPYFTKKDLTNLPNWQACIKTSFNGQKVPPFTLHTTLPPFKWDPEMAQAVRNYSRKQYGRPREHVEKEIETSMELPEDKPPLENEKKGKKW